MSLSLLILLFVCDIVLTFIVYKNIEFFVVVQIDVIIAGFADVLLPCSCYFYLFFLVIFFVTSFFFNVVLSVVTDVVVFFVIILAAFHF